MIRDKFIRKWLANPQKQYNEQCRDEMRDDLDLVIQAAISKSVQKQLITEIMNEDAKDGLYEKKTAVEWLFHTLWEEPKDKFTWYAILQQAKEIEKEQDKFSNAPIHDKKAIIEMMNELHPKEMIEVVKFIQSKIETYGKQ